jgi:hypothetical protein
MLSNEENRYNAAYSWPWGEKDDVKYTSARLSVVDFQSKFCFDGKPPSAQSEENIRG